MFNNGEKIRSHISVVLEAIIKLFTTLFAIVFIIISNYLEQEEVDDVLNELGKQEEMFSQYNMEIIIGICVAVVFFILYIAYSLWAWKNTYIKLEDNTLISEKTIIGTKRNTIAIQNISNINTEQGILNRILGTCKIKLDTNSRTTADTTDFEIVLKKNRAYEFKAYIEDVARKFEGIVKEPNRTNSGLDNDKSTIASRMGDISDLDKEVRWYVPTKNQVAKHGIMNINVLNIIVSACVLIGILTSMVESVLQDEVAAGIMNVIVSSIAITIIVVTSIYEVVTKMLKYYGYKIARKDNRIMLSYGFFKKINYTLPVDKINSIVIKQSFIARLFKLYRVDVVNIGMGDDEKEKDSFLLLYDTYEGILEKLNLFLPELAPKSGLTYEKQPKIAFGFRLVGTLKLAIVLGIILAGLYVTGFEDMFIATSIAIILLIWNILHHLLAMFVQGVEFEEKDIKIVSGVLARRFQWVDYDKIQYIEYGYSLFSKKFNLTKADIYILASSSESRQSLPYFDMKYMDIVQNKIIKNSVCKNKPL